MAGRAALCYDLAMLIDPDAFIGQSLRLRRIGQDDHAVVVARRTAGRIMRKSRPEAAMPIGTVEDEVRRLPKRKFWTRKSDALG